MNLAPQNRRALIRTLLSSVLGWLTVTLLRRSQICTRGGGCKGCVRYAQCALPQKEGQP